MKYCLPLIFIILLACQDHPDIPSSVASTDSHDTTGSIEYISDDTLQQPPKDTARLEEYFTDSLQVGKKGHNKIQVAQYSTADSNYVIVNFFSRQGDKWILKNAFRFEKYGVVGCDPQLSDFNNDGYKDMTYISNEAARGANEVRRLFIYDKKSDQLISLKNSESYPNMEYNKKLNCIDAFALHGGCTTIFLKIAGDSLIRLASVDLSPEGLTITEYDKNGKGKVILSDTTTTLITAGFMRYSNYKPLQE